MTYFAGLDGGASSSTAVILNDHGKVLATVKGPTTQLWLVGIIESAERIIDLVKKGKEQCGIAETKLASIGISISGGDQPGRSKEIVDFMYQQYSKESDKFVVKSDTFGPVATCSKSGAVVLISGTGSNCQYIEPGGKTVRCGGWGHMIDEPGSAYWIAHEAIKRIFRHYDNFEKSENDPDLASLKMLQYFKSNNRDDMLCHFYSEFKKPFVAGFCQVLSQCADDGDAFCKDIFNKAGGLLAQHVLAILPVVTRIEKDDLIVVCVGSVWESWSLLNQGFLSKMKQENVDISICLVRPIISCAFGAALLGANETKFKLNPDIDNNFQVLQRI